jgi:uncharacterized protein YdhG (YjbR/CyaY superfamily)
MKHFNSVDEYIENFEGLSKERLIEMRKIVQRQLPNAEERISYSMPAYFINKKLVVYFAGFKNHIGMYPGRTNSAAYNDLAEKYAHGKSTARFSHSELLPNKVIEKFIQVRLRELDISRDQNR